MASIEILIQSLSIRLIINHHLVISGVRINNGTFYLECKINNKKTHINIYETKCTGNF